MRGAFLLGYSHDDLETMRTDGATRAYSVFIPRSRYLYLALRIGYLKNARNATSEQGLAPL